MSRLASAAGARPGDPATVQRGRTALHKYVQLVVLSERAAAVQRAGTVTADTPAGRRFAAFGPGSVAAFPPGSVFGEQWISIGSGTLIGASVSLSAGLVPGQALARQRGQLGDVSFLDQASAVSAAQAYRPLTFCNSLTGPDPHRRRRHPIGQLVGRSPWFRRC